MCYILKDVGSWHQNSCSTVIRVAAADGGLEYLPVRRPYINAMKIRMAARLEFLSFLCGTVVFTAIRKPQAAGPP